MKKGSWLLTFKALESWPLPSNPVSYINCLCPHTHTFTRCTWQQHGNKLYSKNTDFLENNQVLTSLDLPVFFFGIFLNPPSCQKPTPASSVSLSARNGKMHEANSLRGWIPARKRQRKRETVRFGRSGEIFTIDAAAIGYYSTAPFQFRWKGKRRQLWSILMRLNNFMLFFKVAGDAASRFHSWLTFDKQARDTSGSWNPPRNLLSATSNENLSVCRMSFDPLCSMWDPAVTVPTSPQVSTMSLTS